MYGLCFGFQNKLPFLHGKAALLDRLLHCSYCTGFHSGWIAWLFSVGVAWELPTTTVQGSLLSVLTWAFIGAATCYILDVVVQWLEVFQATARDYVQVIAASNGIEFEEGADTGDYRQRTY